MSEGLKVVRVEHWAPHVKAAPLTEKDGERLNVAANGTRFCVGGWQVVYEGVKPGATYRMTWRNTHRNVAEARDSLRAKAYWTEVDAGSSRPDGEWQYLVPEQEDGAMVFARDLTAPKDATHLTLRCTLRWTVEGESSWEMPVVEQVSENGRASRNVRVAVVTGASPARKPPYETMADNTAFYLPLCEAAIAEGAELVVLPEIALQWQMNGHAYDLAVGLDSEETRPYAELATSAGCRILLGLFERDADAVHNSAVLYGPDGIEGVYRKVHLAVGGESESGIMPGDGFPVFDTPIGRVGCNICMDSSALESSRMAGLNGADLLLLPIMGDHRADRWSRGRPIFNESRWKAIMRTRAMDTQATMVIARNNATGSCIVNRKGDFLAWNDGDSDYIIADVPLDDGFRTWNGGCFRDVNWMQRRPHVYEAVGDRGNFGGVG